MTMAFSQRGERPAEERRRLGNKAALIPILRLSEISTALRRLAFQAGQPCSPRNANWTLICRLYWRQTSSAGHV